MIPGYLQVRGVPQRQSGFPENLILDSARDDRESRWDLELHDPADPVVSVWRVP